MHYMCVLLMVTKLAMLVYTLQILTDQERALGCSIVPLFLVIDRVYSTYDPEYDWNMLLCSVYTARVATFFIQTLMPVREFPSLPIFLLTVCCGSLWTSMCWYMIEHKKWNSGSAEPVARWVQFALTTVCGVICTLFVCSFESGSSFILRVVSFASSSCLITVRIPTLDRFQKVIYVLPTLFVSLPINSVFAYMILYSEVNPRPFVYPTGATDESDEEAGSIVQQ